MLSTHYYKKYIHSYYVLFTMYTIKRTMNKNCDAIVSVDVFPIKSTPPLICDLGAVYG